MTITIDKSGRVVLPKYVRERLDLHPGSRLEVTADNEGVHLRIPKKGAGLVRKQGFLIYSGEEKTNIDIVNFVNQIRLQQSAYNMSIDE